MPTYHACGVTARVTTCGLQPTLSNVTDLRMGGEQRKDAARMQKALSGGQELGERPIGADSKSKGVVQFIGANGDMPLLMVEASEQLRRQRAVMQAAQQAEDSDLSGTQSASDSPLTSLGPTPTPTHVTFDATAVNMQELVPNLHTMAKPHAKPKSQARSEPQKKSKTAPSSELHTLEEALQAADRFVLDDAQALVLEIQLGRKTFLPTQGHSASAGNKDLKIEVFVNGDLAVVEFINAKRVAAQVVGDKIRFAGTRVHRQIERPWIYRPEDVPARDQDAGLRWSAIATALTSQARLRGTDRYGNQPPSSDFIDALTAIKMPDQLASISAIGVVDVVITAGKGQKYGPETAYLPGPTRMDDPNYKLYNPAIDPFLHSSQDQPSIFDGGAVSSPFETTIEDQGFPMQSSPELALRSQGTIPSGSASPSTAKKTPSLARDFGFEFSEQESISFLLGRHKTSHGVVGLERRTLRQRLGDIKKMSEKNRAKELAKLREEVDDVLKVRAKEEGDGQRPAKRARTNSDANYIDPLATLLSNTHTMAFNRSVADDDAFGPTPSTTESEAVLTQDRLVMTLDAGAVSTGSHLRRIAAQAPSKKTPRKTKAAALAYSPTKTEIKEQRSGRPKKVGQQTPQKTRTKATAATPEAPTIVASPIKTKSTRGANRNTKQWVPGEVGYAETLEGLEVSELYKCSCVTFPEDKSATRQVQKERGGMFKEECVVVGMRFVVY